MAFAVGSLSAQRATTRATATVLPLASFEDFKYDFREGSPLF